jgi:fatty-acyl-CoA synthase
MSAYGLPNVIRKNRLTAVNPSRTAIVFEERRITYDELDERTSRLASALAEAGFRKCDRATVLLYNRPEYVELLFAVAKLGGVIVPVNYYFKPAEVRHIVEDSGAAWMFCEEELWPIVRPIREEIPHDVTYVSVDAAEAGTLDYEGLVRRGSPAGVDRAVALDDMVLLQYTSGTTGFPKGATHTHATILFSTLQQIADLGITRRDTQLVLPAFCWAAGFHELTMATWWAGGTTLVRRSRAFDAEQFCELVERHGVTQTFIVPSALRMVLDSDAMERHDLSTLRLVLSGAEPVPVPVIEEFQRRLPSCDLIQGYGMSEFPALLTFLEAEYAISKRGSVGRAALLSELRVVDAEGGDCPVGEPGEILCRAPSTMVGYFGKPEATAATMAGDWLHTGDQGYVDEDGFLYISGRVKDMIISGGLNVYPAEIERVLELHPAVAEVAVIGVPDDRFGETGRAIIVLRDGLTATEEELEAFAREQLANFKLPRQWVLRREPLPRTTSGKIQRFLLAEGAAAGVE